MVTRSGFLKIRIASCFITMLSLAEHSAEIVNHVWQFVLLIIAFTVIWMTVYGDLDELSDQGQKKSAPGSRPKALKK